MAGRLDGKVAIITGAGCVGPCWDNGRAACAIFGREEARIFGVDMRENTMAETVARTQETGAEIATHTCDVTDNDALARMVAACVERFGRVYILVNNVGGSAKGGAVALPEENWDRQMEVNLKTVFLTCKHDILHMEGQGSGAIVNTASTSGLRFTGAAQVGYAAAKAGIIHFSRVSAVEYVLKGIRINTVVPGHMHTPMVDARLPGQRACGHVDALLVARQKRIPLGFMGDGRDAANADRFLASDEARFVTGTEIVVDGSMIARCD